MASPCGGNYGAFAALSIPLLLALHQSATGVRRRVRSLTWQRTGQLATARYSRRHSWPWRGKNVAQPKGSMLLALCQRFGDLPSTPVASLH